MKIGRMIVCAAFLAACGGDEKGGDKKTVDQAAVAPVAQAPIAPKPMGLESPAAFNYPYGKGEKEFEKTGELVKKKDWPAIQAACEATLLKDPGHLDAHYLLATARAQQGKLDDTTIDHLSVALAGDWGRWGAKLETDADLAPLVGSSRGARLKELNAAYKDGFVQAVKKGVLLVGRRTGYKPPSKPGNQPMSTRAELYAYDPAAQRYVRVTQSGSRLAGWLLAPSGDELAYVAWAKVNLPAPPKPGETPPPRDPPLLEARVGVVNLRAIDAPSKEAKLKDIAGVTLQYQAGDELLVTTHAMKEQWDVTSSKTYTIDPTTGDVKELDPAPAEGTTLMCAYDFCETVRHKVDGVEADWSPASDSASDFRLSATKKTIALPRAESALRSSFVWSASQARVAFSTWTDPCNDHAPARISSVYVVEAATGKLKHLFKGEGTLDARWISDDQLIYEDDKGGLRLHDAAQGRELVRLTTRGGLALDGVGAASGPICRIPIYGTDAGFEDETDEGTPFEEPVE